MNFRSKRKTISFIGLFFLASISLHSFAHIDEAPVTEGPQIECQSCHNDISSDIESFSYINEYFQKESLSLEFSQDFYPELKKPFNSQAPPKI